MQSHRSSVTQCILAIVDYKLAQPFLLHGCRLLMNGLIFKRRFGLNGWRAE